MRMIFSLIGLLIVLAVVGFLAKTQLPVEAKLPNLGSNSTNLPEQGKQFQTQVKDQVIEAMKTAADAQQKALDSGNIDKNTDKPADKTGSAY
jgi:competence protein ComGC